MRRRTRAAAGLAVAAAMLIACETADANLTPEERGLRESAYDCATDQYDRIFLAGGQNDELYKPDERNIITGMLRDSAAAGRGADADADRRIRNLLGDDYGRLFLDAYDACMRVNT